MSFDKQFNTIYQFAIKKAIESAGYQCIRADELARGGNILSNIVRNINDSDLVVVDITSKNPNVMYELGLSHGLKKNVIIIVRDMSDIPFDLTHFHIIEYKNENDLACGSKLQDDIEESIQSIENKTQNSGNPVLDYLGKDEQPPNVEDYKRLQADLEKKNQEIIKQQSRLDTLEPILKNFMSHEKMGEEQAIKKIKERKYIFKEIGNRE